MATLAAVVIVPSVLLVAIKVASPSPVGPGSSPATTAAGDDNRLKAMNGRSPVVITPGPSTSASPGAASPSPVATAETAPPTAPPASEPMTSYTRVTEAWLSGAPSGDNQHLTENTSFVLRPAFSMDAQGTRVNTVAGTPTTSKQRVVIKNKTLTAYEDDVAKEETKLSDDQVGVLSKQSDSRQLTYLVRLVAGSTKKAESGGSTRYGASVTLKDITAHLPDDAVAEIEKVLPLTSTVAVDLLADKLDRPTSAQLTAAATEVDLKVVMTFKNYR